MALEPNVAAAWIYSQLAASTALTALVGGTAAPRISLAPAPQGQIGPYVTYQMQAGRPVSVTGGVRIFSDMSYLVWGGMQTRSYGGTLGSIAAAIDGALDLQAGTATGGLVIGCTREEDRMQVDPDDPSWRFYGGLYRLEAQRDGV